MANTTTITGNLTREPEIRYTKEGQATAQLGIAVNRRWQDRTTQEWQEAVSFFDVICWRDLAENVALSLSKGMRVVVTGRLEQRSWENEEGEHRSKVEITADDIGPSLRFATADIRRVERRSAADEVSDEVTSILKRDPEDRNVRPLRVSPSGDRFSHLALFDAAPSPSSFREAPIGTPPGALWPSAPGGVSQMQTTSGRRHPGEGDHPPADSEPSAALNDNCVPGGGQGLRPVG